MPLDDLDGFPRLSPGGDRRTGTPMSVVGIVACVGLVITIISLIFTAGYTYRGLVEQQEKHDKLDARVTTDYVRKDVNAQQMITIQNKLDEISSQLAGLQQRGNR